MKKKTAQSCCNISTINNTVATVPTKLYVKHVFSDYICLHISLSNRSRLFETPGRFIDDPSNNYSTLARPDPSQSSSYSASTLAFPDEGNFFDPNSHNLKSMSTFTPSTNKYHGSQPLVSMGEVRKVSYPSDRIGSFSSIDSNDMSTYMNIEGKDNTFDDPVYERINDNVAKNPLYEKVDEKKNS